MNAVAMSALQKLLAKTERAWAKNTEINTSSLLFSPASYPPYFTLSSAADKQACHSTLKHAQHKGAIRIEWDIVAGDNNQIKRIFLQNPDKLAQLLDIVPRWHAIEDAKNRLQEWYATFPIIPELLDAWRNGRKPRGLQPKDVPMLADAARIIMHCRMNETQDISIRRLSTQLRFNSKHIESLKPALDILTATELNQSAREADEIYSELGIVKYPLPILLTGPARVTFENSTSLSLPLPYVGLSPHAIQSIKIEATCKAILSIENLTTFHELSRLQSKSFLIIYSNGMPSPSWRKFYCNLIKNLPDDCQIWHWGDIDGGGFRIAARIATICHDNQRLLRLYMMNPGVLPVERQWRPLDAQEKKEIVRIATNFKWSDTVQGIKRQPFAYEQEALDLDLPNL